jgi:hypothetical protein
MRTVTEIEDKIEHLTAYKNELNLHFKVIQLSNQSHAVLSAFYSKVDSEIDLLRWVLSQIEQTWSDDMSDFIDMQTYFDSLPKNNFPRKPHRQELVLG